MAELRYFLDCDGSSGDKLLEIAMAKRFIDVFNVFKKKQASYGSGNIATFGIMGVVIRMYDKMQRLKRMIWDDLVNPLDDESIEDTFIDMADYAVIALIVMAQEWPDA